MWWFAPDERQNSRLAVISMAGKNVGERRFSAA